jgi:hypothetical protein
MLLVRLVSMMVAGLCAASAGTLVDASSATLQSMGPGDALRFLISNLSVPSVAALSFQFVTAPLADAANAQFGAELTSPDGSLSVPFTTPITISEGRMWSSQYQGPVTVIGGSLQLPSTVSKDIFQNTRATLILYDLSGPETVGVPGYTLSQDLFVTLTSGRKSAGAVVSKVLYQDPPQANVPEPDSGMLIGGAGLLLCAFLGQLKRISRLRI